VPAGFRRIPQITNPPSLNRLWHNLQSVSLSTLCAEASPFCYIGGADRRAHSRDPRRLRRRVPPAPEAGRP